MKKCRLYLMGLPTFTLIVHHQPLVTILDRYTLDQVKNPRLQRMKEQLSSFTFQTKWPKGKEHQIPDALSRAPSADPLVEDLEDKITRTEYIQTVVDTALDAETDEERSWKSVKILDYQIKMQSSRILWRNRKFIHIDYPEPSSQLVRDTESETGRTSVTKPNRRVHFEEEKPRPSNRERRPDFFEP